TLGAYLGYRSWVGHSGPGRACWTLGGGAYQRQVLEILQYDHRVHWSCATLRKLLSSLSAGMATPRQAAQTEQVVRWLHQARASTGRLQPILAVGRDGVNVPLRHKEWKEGAT